MDVCLALLLFNQLVEEVVCKYVEITIDTARTDKSFIKRFESKSFSRRIPTPKKRGASGLDMHSFALSAMEAS